MDKDRIKELTSSIRFGEPYDHYKSDHRKIYDNLDKFRPSDASSTVPPFLIFYAARNILAPSFIVGQIPDLLNLLTAIEIRRQFAILKSDEALEWQKYYKGEKSNGEDVRLLAADEVRTLQCFSMQKKVQRREYIVLIRTLILLYIYYLWTAPESCLLAKRLNDFFPGSVQGVGKPSELHFHENLSEDEKEYITRLRLECKEWLNLVVDWEKKREETLREQGQSKEDMEMNFKDDFFHAFPPPSEPSETAHKVEIYMRKVEDIVGRLEQWFPQRISGVSVNGH